MYNIVSKSPFTADTWEKKTKVIIYGNQELLHITSMCLQNAGIPFYYCVRENDKAWLEAIRIDWQEMISMCVTEDAILLLAIEPQWFEKDLRKLQQSGVKKYISYGILLMRQSTQQWK